MAILIPSKNIYDKQNPKVRDNVIDRIEVEANTPSLVYKYDERVAGADYDTHSDWFRPINPTEENVLSLYSYSYTSHSYSSGGGYYVGALGAGVRPFYKTVSFEIPKLSNNNLINKIFYGTNVQGQNNIRTTVQYEYSYYSANPTLELDNLDSTVNESDRRYKLTSLYAYSPQKGKVQKSENLIALPTVFDLKLVPSTTTAPTLIMQFNEDETNISTAEIRYNEDTDMYEVSLTVLVGLSYFKVAFGKNFLFDETKPQSVIGCDYYSSSYGYPQTLNNVQGYGTVAEGIIEYYKPLSLNISFYGNTIELDIKDEVLNINGKTAKKVHSIDGNELMQTSNYYQSTDTNAIKKAFGKTQEQYARGKETATIRCSISDYFDYENGDKVIAIDNSTGKMSFELYDQVIPMVYGADGKDHPISLYEDGTPKAFQVLGTNIYYDGAVWQELSLQEVDKDPKI